MKIELNRLIRYDLWANRECVSILKSEQTAPERCWKIMAHIVAVHRLFLSRIKQRDAEPVWPNPDSRDWEKELNESINEWQSLLQDGRRDFQDQISYTNSRNESWTSSLQDIIVHVVLHGSYHRGQIAALMGSADLQPAYTDYIHATRNGLVDKP